MAESAVTFLLDKLTTLLYEDVKLKTGVRGELESIRDGLESMLAVLRFADAVEDSNPEVKIYVKQVIDVAYAIEDVFDDFMLHKVQDNRDQFCGPLRKISSLIKYLKASHQLTSEIQGIKTRISNISAVYQRYRHNFNSLEKSSSSTTTMNTWYGRREDSLLLEEVELIGIEKPKSQLIGWLVKDDRRLNVISVVGMGGLGKTTLVKKVYDDAEVKKHFECHAWIDVSQSFKIVELLQDMIYQLYAEVNKPAPRGVETMDSHSLKSIIKEFLQHRRYVLVLDDLWSISTWDDIKYALPYNEDGSRVVLTTRNAAVASATYMAFEGMVYSLEPLSAEESWKLFCKKTFSLSSCPPHLKIISESILARCEGLPLAIVAISGVLATKDTRRIDEWEMVHRSLGVELEENDKLKSTKKILSLSYYDLPYYLKSCFLYFSIFPEGHLIEHMRLIRLWIAEGFVKVTDGTTVEEVAHGYLNELLNRSLIQVAETTSDGRVKTYRIHDLLREIVILKSKDQNFVAIAKEQNMIWPEKIRRLSVNGSLQNPLQGQITSQLRSLLVFTGVDSSSESSSFKLSLGGCRLLNVLDLQGGPLQKFPSEVVNSFHLKYLSLRYTKVKVIPSSIEKLQNLETLDLKHSKVTELPVQILKLSRLRHLLVYLYKIGSYAHFHSKYGFKALAHIGGLRSLQKLCFIEANQGGSSIMKELGNLNQLRRLGIIKLRREDGKDLCLSIQKMTSLRALSITSVNETEVIDLNYDLSPPQLLQRLYLAGRLEQLPDWIPLLHSLVKVFLKWSRLPADPLVSLQCLPNLVHLEFIQVYDGETFCFKAGGFQRLKLLGLDMLEGLKSVIVEEGAMPCLEKLMVQRCMLLQKVPSGIEYLHRLKVLEFFDMPNELIMTLKPDGGEDYWKVAHVPEVYSTYWRDGGWDVHNIGELKDEQTFLRPGIAMRSFEPRNVLK